jgi:type I restriction enzyme S subunit
MSAAWPSVALREVLQLDLIRESVDPSKSYPMVGVLSFARGLFDREPVENGNTSYKHFYRLTPDHIVMSQLFGWEGALALSNENYAGKYLSPQFPTFLSDPKKLDRQFLGWLMRRPTLWSDLGTRASGMGDRRRTLTPDALFACQVPLPPLAEQRRIVARIDELAAKVDEAQRSRSSALAEVAAFLPSHLGATFQKLATHYPVHSLGELSSHIVDGPHQTPTYLSDTGGVPFVTVKNMVTGKLSFNNLNYVSRQDHQEFTRRCRAERGDVLYSKDGATKGRPCYVDTDKEFSFFVSVALIKPLRDRLDGRYLTHLLNSSWIKDRMIDKSRGDMIPHIVLREIRAFPVPLPSLDEQSCIVSELDALRAKVDSINALQAETAAELDAMLPAILDKAFKGELV